MNISTKLKKLRLSKNLTQIEMANALNISPNTYIKYENGSITPTLDTIEEICIQFNVIPNYFFDIPISNQIQELLEIINDNINKLNDINGFEISTNKQRASKDKNINIEKVIAKDHSTLNIGNDINSKVKD